MFTIEAPDPGVAVSPQAPFFVFQQAEGYRVPAWPPVEGEQRPMMHLDFQVGDLDEAIWTRRSRWARPVAAVQPQEKVRVLLDPAGHPFCLCFDAG
ncbi:VOC family protein [Amycolatopsis sp. H20-H5]|uniref:VOC family protein n=1 Tax=Amycolatopsis sp. H20-H5 TaxID=3046309 RepID=UPI002DB9F65F|nr:VOC family protein [Amycolatopsis sp. H20-H5]MEC3981056.1 VOC family protein [Amycolatopsis sp. H20-H5]